MTTGPSPELVETRLPGGRMGGAVRVGDTVRRPAGPGSTGVAALLTRLEQVGFVGAPSYLGRDEQGRDALGFLPGDTIGEQSPWPAWVFSDDLLAEVGVWLRRLHEATAGWEPPATASWFTRRPWSPGLIIGHHDAAPWNVVTDGGRLVGFVDWDTAAPAHPEFDLAWTALTWTPLLAEPVLARTGYAAPADRSRRLHLLLDAYGYRGDRTAFGVAVADRARTNAAVIGSLPEAAGPRGAPLRSWAADLISSAEQIDALPGTFWQPT